MWFSRDYKIDYGSYIFNNNGVNQYEWLCKRLSSKPESKSATISLHKAVEDKLTCLSLLDFKIRDGKLDMTAVYRSQNVFSSQPGNIIALRKLQEQLSEELKVKVGKVELSAISAHIYEYDLERAKDIYNNFKI